jgi:cytochrome c oxidase cbb3-type subunit 1
MPYPYLLMAALFAGLAALFAADAWLVSWGLMPWFNGLRWLRVHFITLGMLSETLFGFLPILASIRAQRALPALRWDIWVALNAGLLTLLVGIPLVNTALILAGGTLVFLAATLLWLQLRAIGAPPPEARAHSGRRFYLMGLAYLLLGIILGTGLWLGWGQWLMVAAPLEVHIHANNWGFMSLVFAGLIVDLYPGFAGRPLAWPRSIGPIFWMMSLGALGAVTGPWVANAYITVPAVIVHITATGWLLLNVIVPLRGTRWSPGLWHLITAYAWIIAPVLMAPLVVFNVAGLGASGVEALAPQALIYGWVLQFGFAVLPLLFRRAFLPQEKPRLGGNWFSLAAVHLGGLALWVSIFAGDSQPALLGVAYGLWLAALLPIVAELLGIVRAGVQRLSGAPAAA